jgi:hypothetical protein
MRYHEIVREENDEMAKVKKGAEKGASKEREGPLVVTYEMMTPEQKRIVDAGTEPGIPVPSEVIKDPAAFIKWMREN